MPSTAVTANASTEAQRTPDFRYTGFLRHGEVRFAILNGREYGIGDTVKPGDFTVRSIDPDRVVLVASWGGDDRHPTWYLNLRDHPEVEITTTGAHREMTARTASADEKAELWPRITATYPGYAGYQTKTDRDIPVVILDPR